MLYFILLIAVLMLILPVSFLLAQVLAAILLVKQASTNQLPVIKPTIAVLMPAHNESLVIAQTVQSVLMQLSNQDQLLVVADNCNDDTAIIAKNLGANVLERVNLNDRGKGYALDFGMQHLKNMPPEVVIIIDADCMVHTGAIDTLARACYETQHPMQALYLMQPQPNPSLKARVAAFAWLVKNKVRPLGLKALGLPCQLMGTGMAFIWHDIAQINLASSHIVEDMKLGVDLTRMNKPPIFLPEALVTSIFPPSEEATNTQRARWEHGHLSIIMNEAPRLLIEAIKTKNIRMLALAYDLIIPPLAVLSLICVIVFMLCFAASSKLLLLLASILLIALISAVLLAWLFFGRALISFKQLCFVPVYALAKIPLYIKFFVSRQVDWVRSKRN